METINKFLIGLVALAILAYLATSYMFISKSKEESKAFINSDKEIPTALHPYNECIKLYIDQSNKQGVECDFDKAKSVCFELIKDNK